MNKQLVQQRIQMVREGFGLDRHQFAARIGVSYTAVWNWETKGSDQEFRPKDDSLRSISNAFQVSFDWLKYGTGTAPIFATASAPKGDEGKLPNVITHLEGAIAELEKHPLIGTYRNLLKARELAAA